MKYMLEKIVKRLCYWSHDAFLTDIVTILKILNPYHLNLAKSKIFNVVQEIEMTSKQQSFAQLNDTSTVPITTLSETNLQNSFSN